MTRLPLPLLALLVAAPLSAQSLSDRVAHAPDGVIHLSFRPRPGVCGNGENISTRGDRNNEWQGQCEEGPVLVSLTKAGGAVTRIRTYVGGAWRSGGAGATDLGTVSAPTAGEYLLALATRMPKSGEGALFAATLADSVTVWPRLLGIARDPSAPKELRRSAVFWLGQATGDAVTAGLDSIVADSGDREVREAAVFAVSRRPADQSVPALIAIARTNRDPQVRRTAIFWLGRSGDPRAVDFFAQVLGR